MAVFKNFLGRSYQVSNRMTDAERTVNWFGEKSESEGATSAISFLPTPGVEEFVRVAKIGWRGLFSMNGRTFGVAQDGLYEITFPAEVGTATLLGTVAIDNNPVTISTNGAAGDQLFITSGDKGYCLELSTNTLTEELTSGATQGGYLGGYFLAFDAAQSRVRYSALLDGTTWDPLDFFERSNQPDSFAAMGVTSWNYICLPGGQTGEMWYPNGGFPLPFEPDPAGAFIKGIVAPFSLANAGGAMVWLSTNVDGSYEVVAASGLEPQRISDFGLEHQIAEYAREFGVDDAVGQSFRQEGHTFYRLTFPAADKTWQYDFSTGWWTEVGTWIAEEDDYTYFRPVFTCFAFDKTLAGDRESGVLYEMSPTFTTDVDEREIRRLRRTPAVVDQQKYVFHHKLGILMEVGVGTISGQGQNPKVMLRYSDDGGIAWGNEIECEIGEMGQYSTLVWFWQLGMARNRVYELTCTDPVLTKLTNAYLYASSALQVA